jgi:hypothetical protein
VYKSLKERRSGTSKTTIEVAGRAVATGACGDGLYGKAI